MEESARILQLDNSVVNKIAAGEVIERPASVVKELLDNSVDALATRIEVEIVQGGAELIRVVDDGEGIHPDDLLLAVSSHATSKIQSAEDLFEVRTMGFRGEALASIAEVSHLRLRTRQADRDAGVELEVRLGDISQPRPSGGPRGTLIEVSQLFANTPVRRKFLKSQATEFGHIGEQFSRIALAHPRLHMVLKHNGKMVHELPASDGLLERIRLFYGDDLAQKLIWVESETEDVRVWGYVAHPSLSKSSRKQQYLFLNGRWIQDRSLQHALGEAYRGLLMTGRFPISFLFLEMPPQLVDVNVHPTKAEVRFRDSQSLYRQLLSTIRTRFLGMDLDSTLNLPGGKAVTLAEKPAVDPEAQRQLQWEVAQWAREQLDEARESVSATTSASLPIARADVPPFQPYPAQTAGEFLQQGHANWSTADAGSPSSPAGGGGAWDGANPGTMSADYAEELPARPPVAVPGASGWQAIQVLGCYIVAETEQGLTIIDQHALHERIMYEALRERVLAGAVESQRLLVPVTVECSAAEVGLLVDHQDLWAELGFSIEEFGKNTVVVTAYPAMLRKVDLKKIVLDLADRLGEAGQKPTRRDILDDLLHMMSCKAAVKAGQKLTPEEIASLLAKRHLIDDAHHCPHGRPTALTLTRDELDRQFGRLG